MKWIEVSITTNESTAEAVSDLMLEMGSNGVEVVDPEAFREVLRDNSYLDYADDGFIESFGESVIVRGYFQDGRDQQELLGNVKDGLEKIAIFNDPSPATVDLLIRDDSEWNETWKAYFKPFELAPGFVVCPSWEKYEAKPGELIIELDPGMAFGTGTHETTKMCAEFAAEYVKQGDRVMDVGCGTAILAITAAGKGASKVTAIDIDDAAVKTAKENVIRNRVEDRIEVLQGILQDLPAEPCDVLLVNIIADVIISLAPVFRNYLKDDGHVVLSGIIRSRQQEVIDACEENGLILVTERTKGEWVAMVFHA